MGRLQIISHDCWVVLPASLLVDCQLLCFHSCANGMVSGSTSSVSPAPLLSMESVGVVVPWSGSTGLTTSELSATARRGARLAMTCTGQNMRPNKARAPTWRAQAAK